MNAAASTKSDNENYIFKVTNLLSRDLIISDLGGIRLKANSTIDLGKKFDVEQIKKSRALAEQIWNGDVWAWDTKGNQIGGWDPCDVETNLTESGTEESQDIAIVCLSGCLTDTISDYVGLKLADPEKYEGYLLYNVFQEKEPSEDTPKGVWFAYPDEHDGVDPYNPSINYLKHLSWGGISDLQERANAAEAVGPIRPESLILYMFDRKTEKYYIFKIKDVDFNKGEICYIRKSLKNVCMDDCKKTNIVFGTNVPDACDTYLYNNFGVSSNISPYLVTGAQSACGLTLSYQSASIKDGIATAAKEAQIYSPYRLWIEGNGERRFYIPLPGGDWQGRYLDLCNPSPLNVVEFFEGRSDLWYKLYEFYQKWNETKDKTYQDLLKGGCILGVYLEGANEEENWAKLPNVAPKYTIDTRISRDLHNRVDRELSILEDGDIRREELNDLFSTGVKFYDDFIKLLHLIGSRVLFNADKISVYVDCNDNLKAIQADQRESLDFANRIFCDSISNVQLTLSFNDLCEVTPISEIDGRVWGKVTDDNGVGISKAKVGLSPLNRSVSTDKNGNYIFLDVPFGRFDSISVEAGGYEEYEYSNVVVEKEVPSVEINFELNYVNPGDNIVYGYVRDENNNPLAEAEVSVDGDNWGYTGNTDSNGYYEFTIPNNDSQMINVYAALSPNYPERGASGSYDGASDVSVDINLDRVINLNVDVVGGTDTIIDSNINLYRLFELGPDNIQQVSIGSGSINNGFRSITFYDLPSSYNNEYVIEVFPVSSGWEDSTRTINITSTATEYFNLVETVEA